jgi:hypothetical protein
VFLVRDVFFDARGGTFADAWERLLAARIAHSQSFARPELFVLDHPRGQPSVCDAVVRVLPELLSFRTTVRGSSAIATHAAPPSIDLVESCTVFAAGVPRRFPARWCVLALTWADELRQEIPEDHRGIPAPGQDMHPAFTGLKLSRRIDETWLCASFALGHVDAAEPTPASELERAAASLGAPKWSETRVLLSPSEVRARKAAHRELALVLKAAPRPIVCSAKAGTATPRYQATLDRIVGQIGYARDAERSEPRLAVMHRALESGNLLELRVDAGGAGTPRLISVELSLLCLGHAPLTFTLARQTPIPNQESLVDLIERAAKLVPEIEREHVPRLEAIVGGSPRWFRALGRTTLAPR